MKPPSFSLTFSIVSLPSVSTPLAGGCWAGQTAAAARPSLSATVATCASRCTATTCGASSTASFLSVTTGSWSAAAPSATTVAFSTAGAGSGVGGAGAAAATTAAGAAAAAAATTATAGAPTTMACSHVSLQVCGYTKASVAH